MKKTIFYVLASVLVCLPFVVEAKHSGWMPANTGACTLISSEGNVELRECDVKVKTTEGETIKTAEFYFTHGDAIKSFTCDDAGEFEATQAPADADGKIKCTFADPSGVGVTGEEILVGKVKLTIDKNSPDEDCTIEFQYNGEGGKVNPQTGSYMPFALIGAGIAAVGAIYFITSKKNKLYKI